MKRSRGARELLRAARIAGWVRAEAANDVRAAGALIRQGLLEPHPRYEGTRADGGTSIYRLTAEGQAVAEEEAR